MKSTEKNLSSYTIVHCYLVVHVVLSLSFAVNGEETSELQNVYAETVASEEKDRGDDSSPLLSAEEIQNLRDTTTYEAQLYHEIMTNYDKDTRPVMNASNPINIYLNFTFSQVLDVNEKEQALSVIIWVDHEWVDEKLIWDPAEFHNITQVIIPSTDIWRPDIVLYNTAEDKVVNQGKKHEQSRVFVSNNGKIFWPPIMRFKSSCHIDITYFPFDDQICHLKLGSWAYDGYQVDLFSIPTKVNRVHALNNSEFLLVDSKVRRDITQYPCCNETYPDIKVFLHIRRQTIQHVFNIIIPCVVLSIISMVGFLIPPNKNDEKISVQLTVLFSLSLYMLLVAESTPHTSEAVPLLGVYLTALMSITAMSTTAHVICDKLVSSSTVRNKAPYLWNKVLHKVACSAGRHRNKSSGDMSYSSSVDQQMKKDNFDNIELLAQNDDGLTQFGETVITLNQGEKTGVTKDESFCIGQENRRISMPNGKLSNDRLSPSNRSPNETKLQLKRHQLSTKLDKLKKTAGPNRRSKSLAAVHPSLISEKGLETLFSQLKQRQDKVRADLSDESDWYLVAARIDRVFFFGYMFSVTLLTLYAFWFKPMQKHIEV